jgi:hypothetical protein
MTEWFISTQSMLQQDIISHMTPSTIPDMVWAEIDESLTYEYSM